MTWKSFRSIDLDSIIAFLNTNAIVSPNFMPVFQDNNGSYVLLYRS